MFQRCTALVFVATVAFVAIAATAVPFNAPGQNGAGEIRGVLVDATGQPLADQRVELRRPHNLPVRFLHVSASGAVSRSRVGGTSDSALGSVARLHREREKRLAIQRGF